jgi:hypothetical protein
VSTIHWVGGDLPQIGKSWCVRALTETIYLRSEVHPLVIDTSYQPKLSQIYNPPAVSYRPELFFTPQGLRECWADRLCDLASQHDPIVVKLGTGTQALFLEWIETANVLATDLEQHFWFVNSSGTGFDRFRQICQWGFRSHWVQNSFNSRQSIVLPTTELFSTHHLPTLYRPTISKVEVSQQPLLSLRFNPSLNSLERIAIARFLKQCNLHLWGSKSFPPRSGGVKVEPDRVLMTESEETFDDEPIPF